MDKKLEMIESKYMKKQIPEFAVGDTVKVYVKIIEEGKQRLQAYEGIVISKKGSGIRKSFTVRRISYGEGVERMFLLHAPSIDKVEVVKRSKVKRAKLHYLRKESGKKAALEEKIAETGESGSAI